MSRNFKKTVFTMITVALIAVFSYSYSFSEGINDIQSSLKTNQIEGTSAQGAQAEDNSGVVMAGVLNVRSGPWGEILGTLKEGSKIEITGKDGVWYKIKFNGREAFVHSGYIATAKNTATAFDGYVNTPGTYLNVRTGAWGKIIGQLNHGSSVEILGKQGDWYQIKYKGNEAFVHSDYIVKTKPADAPSAAAAPSDDNNSSSAGTGGFGGRPVAGGPVTSEYGPRNLYGTYHYGIDIGVPTGTPLKAIGSGKVEWVGWDYGGGNTIKIKYDNGYTSTYCHCKDFSVRAGQTVSNGDLVGHTNNTGAYTTGPHLHFAMKNSSGNYVNPRNVPGVKI